MPDPEPYEPACAERATRRPTSRPRPPASPASGGSASSNEISDEQARDDLGAALGADDVDRRPLGPRRRRADGRVPDEVVARRARPPPRSSCSAGAARPTRGHVKAIDTYWICTAEHGLNASTFTARIVASTGADCGAAMSSAVGALSGPLHGGAPAYVKPMLDEVAAHGDAERT